MQDKTITLGDLRDFIEKVQIYLTKNPNSSKFTLLSEQTHRLSESILREIPVSNKKLVLLSNNYPVPKKSLEIFLEIKSKFRRIPI